MMRIDQHFHSVLNVFLFRPRSQAFLKFDNNRRRREKNSPYTQLKYSTGKIKLKCSKPFHGGAVLFEKHN